MKRLPLLVLIALFAAEARADKPWTAVATLGPTFGNKTTYTTTRGSSTSSIEASDPLGFTFGGEIDRDLHPNFALGVILNYAKYPQADSPDGPDKELSFLVHPRVQFGGSNFTGWAGLAFGLTITGIGSGQATSPHWVVATGSPTSFTWSPRFGGDYSPDGSFVIGGEFAYLSTSGSLSSSTGAPLKLDFNRSWMEISVRAGIRY